MSPIKDSTLQPDSTVIESSVLESPETFIKKPTMIEDNSITVNTSQVRKSEKLE